MPFSLFSANLIILFLLRPPLLMSSSLLVILTFALIISMTFKTCCFYLFLSLPISLKMFPFSLIAIIISLILLLIPCILFSIPSLTTHLFLLLITYLFYLLVQSCQVFLRIQLKFPFAASNLLVFRNSLATFFILD